MRRITLILTLMISAAVTYGQQQDSNGQSFTLEQCITYALENSDNIKNAVLDQQIAKGRVKETRGIGLPQIDGSVNVLYNEKLQRFFNSAGVVGGFTGTPINDLDPNAIVAAGSPFQLKAAGTAELKASQILFNGSYLVGLQAAKAYQDLSVKTANQTREDLTMQVSKAYYTALINTERMKLFDNNISRVDSLLSTTRALNTNGFAEGIDVDRIRVTLNNLRTERDKFNNLQLLSLQLLKFQMNYPMDKEITLVGSIEETMVPEAASRETNWDYTNRADYQVLMANRKLQSLDLKNKYAEGMPSLVLFGTYGLFTQSNNVAGLFKTETPNSTSFNSQLGPDKWYSYSNYGVTMAIPLFSGLQRTYRIQQAKLNLQKIENSVNLMRDGIDLEISQNSITYDNSLKTLVSQRENMQLAQNVARVTKIKYEQGVGSNIEVIDAETALKEAQINYYNALYDALIAKVDLDKAYGKMNPQTSEK